MRETRRRGLVARRETHNSRQFAREMAPIQ
jgi:hypothetical protein